MLGLLTLIILVGFIFTSLGDVHLATPSMGYDACASIEKVYAKNCNSGRFCDYALFRDTFSHYLGFSSLLLDNEINHINTLPEDRGLLNGLTEGCIKLCSLQSEYINNSGVMISDLYDVRRDLYEKPLKRFVRKCFDLITYANLYTYLKRYMEQEDTMAARRQRGFCFWGNSIRKVTGIFYVAGYYGENEDGSLEKFPTHLIAVECIPKKTSDYKKVYSFLHVKKAIPNGQELLERAGYRIISDAVGFILLDNFQIVASGRDGHSCVMDKSEFICMEQSFPETFLFTCSSVSVKNFNYPCYTFRELDLTARFLYGMPSKQTMELAKLGFRHVIEFKFKRIEDYNGEKAHYNQSWKYIVLVADKYLVELETLPNGTVSYGDFKKLGEQKFLIRINRNTLMLELLRAL